MSADIQSRLALVEARFDVEFKNQTLLIEALTHRSFLNEHPSHPTGHNERLEFLGDAVVEIVVTETLYRKFSETPEGDLTVKRAALVCAETLGALWESLGLWDALFLSKGEATSSLPGTKSRKYICANAFEAVIGALYLDQGQGTCRFVLDHLLHARMTKILEDCRDKKGTLQEIVQVRFKITPVYKVLSEEGPDHDKSFWVGCYLGNECVARARGASKKEAQVATARLALETVTQWEGRIAEADKSDSALRRSSKRNGGR